MTNNNCNNDIIHRAEEASKNTKLIGWQFAIDGKWDEAKRIFFEHPAEEAVNQVFQWFKQQESSNLAFEALFELDNSEQFFFGVRITHLESEEKIKVICKLLTTSQKGASLSQVVHEVRTTLLDQNIAKTAPEYLELGVFDLWNRVGSLVV